MTARTTRRGRLVALAVALGVLAGGGAAAQDEDDTAWEDLLLSIGDVVNGFTIPQDPAYLLPPDPAVERLHRSLPFVADMHADRVVYQPAGDPTYQMLFGQRPGGHPVYRSLWHIDVPRLIEGNVALQTMAIFTKGSIDTFSSLFQGLGPLVEPLTDCDLPGVRERDGRCRWSEWNRDPNRARYDSPDVPYERTYGPLNLTRDALFYFDRLQRYPCQYWYDPSTAFLSTPDGCPGFDIERLYLERHLLRASILNDAAERDPRLRIVRTAADLDDLAARRAAGEVLVGALISTEGIYLPSHVATPFEALLDPRTGRLRPPERVADEGYRQLVADFRALHAAGIRMMGLTHFLDNDLAGSSSGIGKFGQGYRDEVDPRYVASDAVDAVPTGADRLGLSNTGRVWVELMLENGVIADMAHLSPSGVAEVTRMAMAAGVPVVSSHGGLAELPARTTDGCQNPRNLFAEQILAIAATGGVIGVGFDPTFVCGDEPYDVARAARFVIETIDRAHIRRGLSEDPDVPLLRGVDHVALGSDFDGNVLVPFDAAHLSKLTEALVCSADPASALPCRGVCFEAGCEPERRALDAPFSATGPDGDVAGSELSKVMGENTRRVMHEVLSCEAEVCAAGSRETPPRGGRGGGCQAGTAPRTAPGSTLATLVILAALLVVRRRLRRIEGWRRRQRSRTRD